MKRNKGITLVALVITIIILLILVGVTISQLTENGLFANVKLAKEKQSEAEIKEKVQLLLTEYQIEKANNEELKLIDYFYQKQDNGEIDYVEDNQDGTIKIELEGYSVTISEKEQSIISIEKSNDIEFLYELTSYENNKFKILIKITDNNNGIDTIEFPDGDIQKCDGQKEVGIDYEIEEGIDYTFIAKNSKGLTKKDVINFTKPEEPVIQATNFGYPTLTYTGVEAPKIEISYDERTEFKNYYSLDDGETWNLYTGQINTSINNIKAKSEHNKCVGLYTEVSTTIQQPSYALLYESYDGNPESFADYDTYRQITGISGSTYNCKFYIEENCWGKEITLSFRLYKYNKGYHRTQDIAFINEYDEIIETYTSDTVETGVVNNITATIPENTKSIIIYSDLYLAVYEVSIQ